MNFERLSWQPWTSWSESGTWNEPDYYYRGQLGNEHKVCQIKDSKSERIFTRVTTRTSIDESYSYKIEMYEDGELVKSGLCRSGTSFTARFIRSLPERTEYTYEQLL